MAEEAVKTRTITITSEMTTTKKYTMEVPVDLDIASEEGKDKINDMFLDSECEELEDSYSESMEDITDIVEGIDD